MNDALHHETKLDVRPNNRLCSPYRKRICHSETLDGTNKAVQEYLTSRYTGGCPSQVVSHFPKFIPRFPAGLQTCLVSGSRVGLLVRSTRLIENFIGNYPQQITFEPRSIILACESSSNRKKSEKAGKNRRMAGIRPAQVQKDRKSYEELSWSGTFCLRCEGNFYKFIT